MVADVDAALPRIESDGRVDLPDKKYRGNGFVLPAGVVLVAEADGVRLATVVLDPDPECGVTREQRRSAVAIVDLLAIALREQGLPTSGQR